MKHSIRSAAMVLAAVVGLVAFAPTEASADHYWSDTHHRNVTYHFAYQHSLGYPVYVNEFGRYFHHGHGGHRIFVSSHHGGFVSSHHGYSGHVYTGHGGHHGGLLSFIFGH